MKTPYFSTLTLVLTLFLSLVRSQDVFLVESLPSNETDFHVNLQSNVTDNVNSNDTDIILGRRIVGGRRALQGEFPYQVGLRVGERGLPFCGGSIISSHWIVTAAHCLKDHSGLHFAISQLRAFTATINPLVNRGNVLPIQKIIIHGGYNPTTHINDIALLKTQVPITGGSPIALPAQGLGITSGTGTVSGWGTTREGGPRSSDLLATDLDVMQDSECRRKYGSIYAVPQMLCGGYRAGGRDTCQGDSGGPFAQNGQLIGVTSFGRGCARPNTPGVYTRVSHYVDWIRYYMQKY